MMRMMIPTYRSLGFNLVMLFGVMFSLIAIETEDRPREQMQI